MTKLRLGKGLQKQFSENLLPPVNKIFSEKLIVDPISSNKNIHRKQILEQGRTDFDKASHNLSGAQKVDLYCYYYFQMHFSSSFLFLLAESNFLRDILKNKLIWFIDIGCGPFTSGMAFNCWAKQHIQYELDVHYSGVDTSVNMIARAQKLSSVINNSIYKTVSFNCDKNELLNQPKFISETEKEVLIILNYCYVFASESLKADDFVEFTNQLKYINNAKVIVLNQNPNNKSLNEKWDDYKGKLKGFNSNTGYPKPLITEFDDLLCSSNYKTPKFTVNCDFIKSF